MYESNSAEIIRANLTTKKFENVEETVRFLKSFDYQRKKLAQEIS